MTEPSDSNTTPVTLEAVDQDVNEEQTESPQEQLVELTAKATALYAVKKYEDAAELYSEATEIQAEINGEMSEDNAELLFSYGRCLFYVAQKTSTVLGGTAASAQLKGSDRKPTKKRKSNGTIKPESSSIVAAPSTSLESVTETAEPADVVPAKDADPNPSTSNNPFFQIEGDAADWADSDDEEDAADGDGDGEEEDEGDEEQEDDFNTAYEVLDLSRVLYLRKLDNLGSNPTTSSDEQRTVQTKVSDIYDLQSEINLESENFPAAASDLRECLALKSLLYTPDNSILAECHYKLSLALEAASQVQQRDGEGNPVGDITVDWTQRNEAVRQQEKAIESCKLRIEKEQQLLDALPQDQTKEKQKIQDQIDDVQDMVSAMAQRLEELRKPPVSVKAEAEKDMQQELMGTMLGQMLAAGATEQQAKLAEIAAGANDLSGMVKRKKPKAALLPETDHQGSGVTSNHGDAVNGNGNDTGKGKGKRKIDEVDSEPHSTEVNGHDGSGKKEVVKRVRIEDVID